MIMYGMPSQGQLGLRRLVCGQTGTQGFDLHGRPSPVQIFVIYGSATLGVQAAQVLTGFQTAGLMLL